MQIQVVAKPSCRPFGVLTQRVRTLLTGVAVVVATSSLVAAQPATEPIHVTGRVLDNARQPAAGAVVTFVRRYGDSQWTMDVVTNANGEFEADLPTKQETLPTLQIRVRSADDRLIAFGGLGWESREGTIPALELTLEESKTLSVRIVDGQGQTVCDANVALRLKAPTTLAAVQTDDSGIASFRVPASERVATAIAWKDHAGFDYCEYSLSRGRSADVTAKAPEFPADGVLTLTLDGATPLTINVTDDDGQPVAGVRLYPWLLQKDSEPNDANLSYFFNDVTHTTDANGTVTFAWIPHWQTGPVIVWPEANEFVRGRGIYDPLKDGSRRLNMRLNRLVPIRGAVTLPDGQPGAGITVEARGAGYAFDGFRGSAVTDTNGQYEILAAPEQLYLVVVQDKTWVSAAQDGFVVRARTPIDGVDFVLRPATRLTGRLLNTETREPIAGESVFVYQYGRDLQSLGNVQIANPEGSQTHICPMITSDQTTNERGEFSFIVGDGRFDIRPPEQGTAENFVICGEPERTIDVLVSVINEVDLSGLVADHAGNPLANAIVQAAPRSFLDRDWSAVTGADGRFTARRRAIPFVAHVTSADKELAAIVDVAADQKSVELQLQPVGSARGRLLNEDGESPAGKTEIHYGVTVEDETRQMFSHRFGGRVVTADDGSFVLNQLVPGHEYFVYLNSGPDGSIPRLTEVTIEPGAKVDLHDLRIPPPHKPYTPPTLDERIASAFGTRGTAVERMARAIEMTDLVNQHLLIVFGNPGDARVRALMDLRYNDSDFRSSFTEEFLVMAIPTDESRLAAATELAASLDESLTDNRGDCLLVVCDRSGKKLSSAEASVLCDGDELSKDKLFGFLRGFRTEPLDARQLLADALKQAADENKRVIVQETATWCRPCHMLARFLRTNREWETDYLWIKIDHRWTGAREMMEEIRDGAEGGIPWVAILDSTGAVLATSNDPTSGDNIGYPGDSRGQLHFTNMLNASRQRMTEIDVREFVEKLKAGE